MEPGGDHLPGLFYVIENSRESPITKNIIALRRVPRHILFLI